MNWRDQWIALAGRITGLSEAGHICVQLLQVNSSDAYGSTTRLCDHAVAICDDLQAFLNANTEALPPKAAAALQTFLTSDAPRIKDVRSGLNGLQLCLPSLASLRAAVEYYLADFSLAAKRRSERAFEHLQRLIAVDSNTRNTWQAAFSSGEVACERLGAVHLLLHGIWAFKAHGPAARTDLVFSDTPLSEEAVARTADALVLTEWKLVRKESDILSVAAAAREQAHLYGAGLLGSIELAEYRYIVLVSRDKMPLLPDERRDSVCYRHISLVVDPKTPSQGG
jgi:hypothetical protein